ncbi:hypothetical protein L218DRAFT_964003 [Marasmius fiardii PR-910]|nr:hypothetical protein L218DRAFT_964003 [Marasmius fiardii PR-910]
MVFNPSDIVRAQVTYVSPPLNGGPAYQLIDPKSPGANKENVVTVEHDVAIEDIRGKEHLYTLDNSGFQYLRHPIKHTNFDDSKDLEEYYRESTEFVKEFTGASRVILFSTVQRRRTEEEDTSVQRRRQTGEENSSSKKKGPARQVHVDMTAAGAVDLVHQYTPSEASDLLQSRRFQVINLWRPISNPALDWPLAFCTGISVDPVNDTFPIPRLRPDPDRREVTIKYSESMGVRYNHAHRWKYLHAMTPNELVLIKNYDTDDSVARFTPHTAFEDPTTPKGSPPRESIELRFLVFHN